MAHAATTPTLKTSQRNDNGKKSKHNMLVWMRRVENAQETKASPYSKTRNPEFTPIFPEATVFILFSNL